MSQEPNIEEENSKEQTPNPKRGDADQEISQHAPEDSLGSNPEISNQQQATQNSEEQSQPEPKPQIPNLEPQPSNMEVHKHPHDVTHKKKWGEYFLEFLMIFLAVFLGFLAENWREHLVEKKREEQFINSLVKDVRKDVNWFDVVTRSSNERINHLDSAILFFSGSTDDKITANVYNGLQETMTQIIFIPFNQTITQLKSSGELRLITNRNVVDSLEDYDRLLRRMEIRRDNTEQITRDFKEALNKTIVGTDLLDKWKDSIIYHKKNSSSFPIKLNSQNLNELINEILSLRSRVASDTTANAFVKRKAMALIEFIRKEYHVR